jgi:hypothetical protein
MPLPSLHPGAMEVLPNSLLEAQTINRIVFTGDVFRVEHDTEPGPNQIPNVFWLHNLIAHRITQLTEIIPEICFRARDYKGGSIILNEAYKVLGLTTSMKSWHQSFWYEDVPSELVEIFRTDYERALVFVFELSPLMECILNRLGCPWVDVGISPLRFLDDLLLTIRLSAHFKSETLLPFAVLNEDIQHAAEHVSRWFRSKSFDTDLTDYDVVFFAQTKGDRTLITYDGLLFSPEEAVARLADLVGQHRLWIKPHPLAPDNPVIQLAIERLGGQLINENVYRILSADIDFDVVTISSSVGREAPWFGKRTQLFSDCVFRRNEEGSMIRGSYESSDFWRVLLEQIMRVNPWPRFPVRFKPNILREQCCCCAMPLEVWAREASETAAWRDRVSVIDQQLVAQLPQVHVDDWGTKETVVGQGVNIQPDGRSAMWIRVSNVSQIGDVYVEFGDLRGPGRATVTKNLVTTGIPYEVIQKPGKYKVVIVEPFGRRTDVGTFAVTQPIEEQNRCR